MELTKMNECHSCVSKREVPGNCHIKCINPDLDMTGNPHGIKHGWFHYPFLFDPTWKEKMCKNFKQKQSQVSAVSESVSVVGKSM